MRKKFELNVDGIHVEITRKRVKYLRIKVNSSSGDVNVSSPLYLSRDSIVKFVDKKKRWIKKHVSAAVENGTSHVPKYVTGEFHPLWGISYKLLVLSENKPPAITIKPDEVLQLVVRPESGFEKRKSVVTEWYRKQIKQVIPGLIKKWEPVMCVKVQDWGVKRMKTRWGTCNTQRKRVWLNLDLAKYSSEWLEYILVHEMTHLLERHHNRRFYQLMDQFMPEWRVIDKQMGGKHWKKKHEFLTDS